MEISSLQEVIIAGEYIPIKFKGDTVEYNAKAFKVKPGAVVEELLKKLPGVEVDKSGNIKAMGENVTKILVDGKEFFGGDIKAATKNLPAESIDKIEIFDKKSENAEFTGVDDGITDRTINILLNENAKKGYFGKVSVGAGSDMTEPDYNTYYKVGGNLYRFSSKFQTAILGNLNNINELGLNDNDRDWGGQIDGLNRTLAGGLNVSYNKDKNNRYFMSYTGSANNVNLIQNTQTEYFLSEGSFDQINDLTRITHSYPHKVNFGLRRSYNKKHKITVDGNFNTSSTTTDS